MARTAQRNRLISGQRAQRSGLIQGPVRAMPVVERLELPQGVEQMALLPDEGAVQQFALAVGFQNPEQVVTWASTPLVRTR
jgi:hypothetical protein